MLAWLERFQHLDRRWVFLGMAVSIVGPLLLPLKLPMRVDERVQAAYDAIEALEPGTKVLLSLDFDPASRPELEPFFRANVDHLFRRGLVPIGLSLWENAPPIVVPILEEIAAAHGKQEGTDWVFLGFKPGKELAIKVVGENLVKAFPTDRRGVPVDQIPAMRGVKQARDFPLLINVSAGFPGTKEYVLQIQGQYDLKIVSSCTAVSGPDYIPFYKSGQLVGLAAGMPGSAQYEQLVWAEAEPPPGTRKMATASMTVLNLGHLYVILLIVLGNVAYFLGKERQGA